MGGYFVKNPENPLELIYVKTGSSNPEKDFENLDQSKIDETYKTYEKNKIYLQQLKNEDKNRNPTLLL